MTTAYSASNALPITTLPTTNGVAQKFVANATNSGAATYAPDGLAAAPIFGLGGQPLQGDEIVQGGIVSLVSFVEPLLNSGNLCWILVECTNGAQQVGAGTGSNQASTVGQVQTGALTTAEGAGTANALTATIASTLTALVDGEPFTIIASASNTAAATLALTLGTDALSALPVVKGNNQPLSLGDIPAAGYPILLNYSAKFGAYVMQNPATGISTPTGVVGTQRDLKAVVGTAGTGVTYSAGQIVVATALNGVSYLLPNFSEAFSGTKTGLGGMDAGALPVSGFVAFYAALTASGQQGIFGTSAASLVGEVYGGSNLPAGVIATALIGVWPTDKNGNLITGSQRARRLSFASQLAYSSSVATGFGVLEPFSIATSVPKNAVSTRGFMEVQNTTEDDGATFDIANDVNFSGVQSVSGDLSDDDGLVCNFDIDIFTPQTLYISTTIVAGTPFYGVNISSYEF